jgi:predicted DNA-binding protein
VALQELSRNLSKTEVLSIKPLIESNIDWYDAIASAIREKIKS